MIDFEECVREGYLRKIPPSVKQAEDQLKKSEMLLEEAKKSIGIKAPSTAVMAAYTAVLDAARAVLFRDGFREKSHVCCQISGSKIFRKTGYFSHCSV